VSAAPGGGFEAGEGGGGDLVAVVLLFGGECVAGVGAFAVRGVVDRFG